MPDVYVEAGEVKGAIDKKYLAPAQAEMKTAIANAAKKTKSGMTTVKPGDGKGILVNVLVGKLAQDGDKVTCSLIGELFELPAKKRFNPGGSASGQATVPGKIEALAGTCVGKAVGALMDEVGPAIAGSQTAPASTGTVNTKSPLIFIAPFQLSYPKDAKAAPQDLISRAKDAITAMMEKKFKANPTRFTLDSNTFKLGSGMPAYVIGLTVESLVFEPKAKEMVAKTKANIAEHPSGNMKVLSLGGGAKMDQLSKPPRDDQKITLLVDAAGGAIDNAITWILKTHP